MKKGFGYREFGGPELAGGEYCLRLFSGRGTFGAQIHVMSKKLLGYCWRVPG